jgi:hypothetical protein
LFWLRKSGLFCAELETRPAWWSMLLDLLEDDARSMG